MLITFWTQSWLYKKAGRLFLLKRTAEEQEIRIKSLSFIIDLKSLHELRLIKMETGTHGTITMFCVPKYILTYFGFFVFATLLEKYSIILRSAAFHSKLFGASVGPIAEEFPVYQSRYTLDKYLLPSGLGLNDKLSQVPGADWLFTMMCIN